VSAYEDEVAARFADAIMDYLLAYGPQRRAVIRREVFDVHRAEFEPAHKGALVDNVIERLAFDKLARERRADSIEMWYGQINPIDIARINADNGGSAT